MDRSRIYRVLEEMKKINLTQMLVCDPLSIAYLTGYYNLPFERFYALYMNVEGECTFFLNKLYYPPQNDIEQIWFSDTDNYMALVAGRIKRTEVLGVDKDLAARFLIPLMEQKAAAGYVNGSVCVDITRGIKDKEEQEKMRVASAINDAAMAQFKELVKPGVTEQDIASKMLDIYQSLGADEYSFEPLVAFGANAADPHHGPDTTVLKDGDCVLFDVGCKKDGYCSDMTRTFFYKEVSDKAREVYETVKKANMEAIAQIRPGVALRELDKTARDIITEAGYGPYFTHRLGHFIGMAEHEFGDVSGSSEWLAKPGMIFSIEPGIYLPGEVGVRIEDLVLVTEDGCEVLNHASKELEILG